MTVRTRTKLTTPPGSEPVSISDAEPEELYSPALAPPEEPGYPSRSRRVIVRLGVLVLLAVIGLTAFRLVTAGQAQDPSLQIVPDESATTSP